jgi:hypothetical protein
MIIFVLVTLLQWVMGFGALGTMRTVMPRSMSVPLALIIGMFLHTAIFFCVDFFNLGMSQLMMTMTAILGVALTHVWWPRVRTFYDDLFKKPTFSLQLYDVVVLGVGLTIGYYVVWAAWYWPVTPFDAMAGIDLVARETVEEGTIVNRVFTEPSLAGRLSNQPFYAPFAMLMQVMYRLIGFTYGQVWLGVMAIAFSWFLWAAYRRVCQPFIANILWLMTILTPELLGYTYLLQTDYANAVFIASGVIMMALTLERDDVSALGASAILLAAGCWSRTETILLVGLGLLAVAPLLFKRYGTRSTLSFLGIAGGASFLMFAVWNLFFLQVYLPVRPDTLQELTGFDAARFISVVGDTFNNVILDKGLWAASFLIFAVIIVADLVVKRSMSSKTTLLWIVMIWFGLEVVGTIFTAAVVEQTLRRGIFKLIPLMFFYVAASPLIGQWGRAIQQWQMGRK